MRRSFFGLCALLGATGLFAGDGMLHAQGDAPPARPNGTRPGLTLRVYGHAPTPLWRLREAQPTRVGLQPDASCLPVGAASSLSGFLRVGRDGPVRFRLRGARAHVSVAGRAVLETAGEPKDVSIDLTRGWHPLVIDSTAVGPEGMDLSVDGAAGPDLLPRLATPIPRAIDDCRRMTPAPIPRTFAPWAKRLALTADERAWTAIPWRERLREAVTEAHAAKMPVLLWAMNGHPLGCT